MRKILTILLLFISLFAYGTDYYVKTGGNDAAAGTSDGTAWAHHPWMSTWTGSVTLQPGDNVYMNKGDTWSIDSPVAPYMTVTQSGTAGNYITTSSYGTGAKPILTITTDTTKQVIYGPGKSYIKFDGLEIVGSSRVFIENVRTHVGIYFGDVGAGSVSHDWVITNCTIHNFKFGGIYGNRNCYNITIGDTTATAVATDASYSNHIYDIGRNAIWLQGCQATTLVGNFYFYYNYIHDVNVDAPYSATGHAEDDCLAYGITVCSSSTSAGNPDNVYMYYNYVANVPSWTAFDVHGGSHVYIRYNRAYNCNLMAGLQSYPIGGIVIPILDDVYLEYNDFENDPDIPYNQVYFVQCNGYAAKANRCYIRYNKMYFTSKPTPPMLYYVVKIDFIEDVEIAGNEIYNGVAGSTYGAIYLGSGTDIKNVLISQNFIEGFGHGIMMYNDNINNVTIVNNVISSNGYGIYCAGRGTNTPLGDLTILNNTILTNTYSSFDRVINFFYMIIPSGRTVSIKNNIIGFRTDPVTGEYIYAATTINGTLAIDYNLYYNTTDATAFAHTGSSRDWTWWQGTAGLDLNSPNTLQSLDPSFANAGGSYLLDSDFELQVGSPAISAGTDVGLYVDYEGNLRDATPTIGAYESESPTPPTLPTVLSYSVNPTTRWARAYGNVVDAGEGTITARGICWGADANPDLTDRVVRKSGTTGSFYVYLFGLTRNTTYHMRAFATSEAGTAYGADVSFTTPARSYYFSNGKLLMNGNKIYTIE